MKPTHILVPIAVLNRDEYHPGSYEYILNNARRVDLSEKGIEERSKQSLENSFPEYDVIDIDIIYQTGYKQCAKDLLTTIKG